MNLSQVKYSKCECARSFPKAHWIAPVKTTSAKKHIEVDVFEPHNHSKCAVCRRNDGELKKGESANGDMMGGS